MPLVWSGIYILSPNLSNYPAARHCPEHDGCCQQQGMKIDAEALAKELNIPVIPIIASKNQASTHCWQQLNGSIVNL